MKEFLGSVRQSLDFRNLGGGGGDNGGFGGLVEKIGSSIRKSRIGIFSIPHPVRALPPLSKNDAQPIRWRKGEMIGCGAFGRVYMGMNLNSGELLAVKQVLIAASSASKEKTLTQVRELEEEVKLLKNLSHPNIVRYLGTAREEDSLNILLEFVPGGSISSLLGKFGSFPESVIRMYTKQLLLGLVYLHKNGIMHRDIKGANILVDNKGCIKLADFGASKQVVELATMNGAKSMKGTPYWMAPEVILQTGHSFSADIWSVGCTVIEMATGKPPWSQQYQEVAALFHIGTTKSHPPIPEHLSTEVKDFLLKCLQKEPCLRPTASELLKHPFVTCELQEPQSLLQTSVMESANLIGVKNIRSSLIGGTSSSSSGGLKDVCQIGSLASSNTVGPENYLGAKSTWGKINNDDDDMCRIDDFTVGASMKFGDMTDNLIKSFNPMSEPTDDFPCKFDETLNMERNGKSHHATTIKVTDSTELFEKGQSGFFSFQSGVLGTDDDDEEVTEPKIRAFLDEKALDLKKLQSPLYEEFYNTVNASSSSPSSSSGKLCGRDKVTKLPPKSKSPTNRLASRRFSAVITSIANGSREKRSLPSAIGVPNQALEDIQPHPPTEWRQLHDDAQKDPISSPSPSTTNCLEVHRKWEEELYQELERRREMLRQAGMGGGNISSPKEGILKRPRELPR